MCVRIRGELKKKKDSNLDFVVRTLTVVSETNPNNRKTVYIIHCLLIFSQESLKRGRDALIS